MTYPDKEKLTYKYDAGGQLEGLTGNKSYSYNYVQDIGYDKFGQRTYIKYCNGTETSYTYDAQMRRLQKLQAKNQSVTFMDNAYTHDGVGNILGVANTASAGVTMGGQMSHSYEYDGLYRLSEASGTYTGAEDKTASYTLAMSYDNMHNITSKKQHIEQTGIAFEGHLMAGYELDYKYRTDKPHQLSAISDNKYRTADSTAVESSMQNINDSYHYDLNGNLVYVNTSDSVQTQMQERQLSWDEENRLRSICDNGYISSYFYDAAGERTVKLHGRGEGIHVNSAFSGGYTQNQNYTLYVSPYMVLSKGGQYTKHIYIGSQRIVSKLGDISSFGVDPRREEYAGEDIAGVKVPDYKNKYISLQEVITNTYTLFEVPYLAVDNNNYVDGEGFCCNDDNSSRLKSIPTGNADYEKLQYYYHPDHLGSASYITNLDGEVVQHIEYVPFGEVFIEERNNTWNTPYLFNGKELDEETGLYMYGARYLNPRTGLWLSVDPLNEERIGLSPYQYCQNNPVMLVDPTGLLDDDITVNNQGIVTKVEKNNEPNRFYDEDGNQLFLNDPENADKNITTKDFNEGDRLYYPLSKSEIRAGIDNAGETSNFLQTAWKSYGKADFTYSLLSPIVADDKGISIKEDYIKKGIFLPDDFGYFRVEGENSIYNLYDAGNFTWGGWMKMNDYSLKTSLKAANWNSKLSGNGSDTKADQAAIKNGYNFYLKNFSKNEK